MLQGMERVENIFAMLREWALASADSRLRCTKAPGATRSANSRY